MEVERELAALAALNRPAGAGPFFCGAGAYKHHIPATVDHVIQRSEFLTSYTPYQPEIAQGTLQVLFEFQTQVAALTGLEVANASMYDGSTACAEAVMMAQRVTRRNKAVLSGGLHPHYSAVTQTIAHAEGMEINRLAAAIDAEAAVVAEIDSDTACVVVQNSQRLWHGHRRHQDRRGGPRRRSPADCCDHRGCVLWPPEVPWRNGR